MKWTILLMLLVFLCGPTRKWYLSQWSFSVPATIGGAIAWLVVSNSPRFPGPPWAMVACALLVAMGFGINAKIWLDDIFKRRE